MKKLVCIFISTLILALGFSAAVWAADSYLVINGFSFDISESGEAVIHEYDGRSANVTIPRTLLGAKVVKIDSYAFFGDTSLASVDFGQATELTSIGDCAFSECTSLSELTIPPQVELSFASFQKCSGLRSLELSEGISEIPAQCFNGCAALEELSIPESVTAIGERAFANCAGLTKIELSDSVTDISRSAFENCGNLTVYCTKNSYALEFAKANNIGYVITDMKQITVTYILGDADGDGIVNISDATAIQKIIADIEVPSFNLKASDINGDGLDISDVTKIQRYLAKFEDPYHIGETVSYTEYTD